MNKLFGLIGNPLKHSSSQEYFNQKFTNNGLIDHNYQLFQLNKITEFPSLIENYSNLKGLNVTIPFKKEVVIYLDQLSIEASETGAVNCIKVIRQAQAPFLIGYNTDIYGFEQSIKPLLRPWHNKAIILGTGGSASAIAYVLKLLKIEFFFVSRHPLLSNQAAYKSLTREILSEYLLIINTTPVGMFPKVNQYVKIPYEYLTKRHLLYDLIYNPDETCFLKMGKAKGATIKNGLQMLHLQAEKSWEIWQD
jgi:shikimate dehydrogenase